MANSPLFLNGDMSSSEDHDDWNDPPPSRPTQLTSLELGDNAGDDMDDIESYRGSQTLEIHFIAIPTLEKLEMRRDEYQSFPEENMVRRCIREVTKEGGLWYKTVFMDGHMDLVSCNRFHALGRFQGVQPANLCV